MNHEKDITIELIDKHARLVKDALEDFILDECEDIMPDDLYEVIDTLSRSSLLQLVRPRIKKGNYPLEIRAEYKHQLTMGGNFSAGERVFEKLSEDTGLNFSAVQPCCGDEYGAYKAIIIPDSRYPIRLYLNGKNGIYKKCL